MHHIAIFASGTGSNAKAIIEYFQHHAEIKIALIISNNENALVLQIANDYQISSEVILNHDLDANCLEVLQSYDIDFIVLAGFLRKIPHSVTVAYHHKIINIHPALLPKFGGKGMYGHKVHEAVVQAREAVTGITIHYVSEHYDEGQIIFQAEENINELDTAKTVAKKVQQLEHTHYHKIIEKVILNN